MKKKLKYIGKRIREARTNTGMTLEQLAEATDLSDSFLGLVERCESGLSLESLINIAEVLGVTTDSLIKRDVTPTPAAEPTSKTTLIKLIENSTDAEAAFMLDFYKLFKRQLPDIIVEATKEPGEPT